MSAAFVIEMIEPIRNFEQKFRLKFLLSRHQ